MAQSIQYCTTYFVLEKNIFVLADGWGIKPNLKSIMNLMLILGKVGYGSYKKQQNSFQIDEGFGSDQSGRIWHEPKNKTKYFTRK